MELSGRQQHPVSPEVDDAEHASRDRSVEGRPLDDVELIARTRDGDLWAYEELIMRYEAIAQRVAYVIVGDADGAADVAQTAFIKAYYALGRFRGSTSFRAWLLRIVANEARNVRRSERRRVERELRLVEDRPPDDAAPSPEGAVFDAERREALLTAINGLREEDRLVIAYRYFLDLSEAEMAEVLGCARGTVKSRLSRALSRLRSRLGVRGGESMHKRSNDG
jgi:RNA polymerase sigma-70 factor (ECF subfamily)